MHIPYYALGPPESIMTMKSSVNCAESVNWHDFIIAVGLDISEEISTALFLYLVD